jgi:hypothetical protein
LIVAGTLQIRGTVNTLAHADGHAGQRLHLPLISPPMPGGLPWRRVSNRAIRVGAAERKDKGKKA